MNTDARTQTKTPWSNKRLTFENQFMYFATIKNYKKEEAKDLSVDMGNKFNKF